LKYSTSLDESTIKKLKHQAVEEDRSANKIIEDALEDYFKKKEGEGTKK
jgi:predicted transcriptional regulator